MPYAIMRSIAPEACSPSPKMPFGTSQRVVVGASSTFSFSHWSTDLLVVGGQGNFKADRDRFPTSFALRKTQKLVGDRDEFYSRTVPKSCCECGRVLGRLARRLGTNLRCLGGKTMTHRITRRHVNAGIGAALISPAGRREDAGFRAKGGEPIKIGFSMAQSGSLAGAGKQALLGAQIWEEEINAKGGLLGRPVKLIYYDDQTNPATVPSIYTKLIDVDKVDLVIGPYGTNLVAPTLPAVIPKGKILIGLFALDANHDFQYPKYFSMLPSGPTPKQSFTEGFFERSGRAKSETANRRDCGRGRRVLAQCRGRRARERPYVRLQDYLR